MISNNEKILLLKGKEGGGKAKQFIFALDLAKEIFIGDDKFRWDESDLTNDEIKLRRSVLKEDGTIVNRLN